MVIIAVLQLVSVLLIGRGVFCGWLCPFERIQELTGQSRARSACRNGVRRPHSRSALWMGKINRGRDRAPVGDHAYRFRGSLARSRAVKTAITSKIHPRVAVCDLCRRIAFHGCFGRVSLQLGAASHRLHAATSPAASPCSRVVDVRLHPRLAMSRRSRS